MCSYLTGVNCTGCGHNFLSDRSTRGRGTQCIWCDNEEDNPEYCVVCGAVAKCSFGGGGGYSCGSEECENRHYWDNEYTKEEDYDDEEE